jgi:hypothetical protein
LSEVNYSFLDRLLHRLTLGLPWVGRFFLDLEQLIFTGRRVDSGGRPVFICGLARAGTTILMRTFYNTDVFRSLTYHDMPFVLMPGVWKRISQPFRFSEAEKERSHGDGILVGFDSPEAFEEVFWRTFCGNDYIFDDCLKTHQVNEEVIGQFQSFVRQVVDSADTPKQQRYLSKNNNNILRLGAIRQAFPDALIIVPFRDPVQQAISLFQLHSKLCSMHAEDRFSMDYMRWLGHHEFGGTHKPFQFKEKLLVSASENKPDNINYWLASWINTYEFLINSAPEDSYFFSFDKFCQSPKEALTGLFNLAGLSIDESSVDETIKAPEVREIDSIDENLKNRASKVYGDLSAMSIKSAAVEKNE